MDLHDEPRSGGGNGGGMISGRSYEDEFRRGEQESAANELYCIVVVERQQRVLRIQHPLCVRIRWECCHSID